MANVDFYILSNSAASDSELFACRLTEKAYSLGHQVFILADDNSQAARLDNLLWTYRDASFIPHQQNNSEDIDSPVLIGCNEALPGSFTPQLLINLSQTVPAFYADFQRIAEIVCGNEEQRQQSRSHYVTYKNAGLSIDTHDM